MTYLTAISLSYYENRIIHAMLSLSLSKNLYDEDNASLANPPPLFLKTREIAEACNMSIYKARYHLLKMEEKGFVEHNKSHSRLKTQLQWKLVNPEVTL